MDNWGYFWGRAAVPIIVFIPPVAAVAAIIQKTLSRGSKIKHPVRTWITYTAVLYPITLIVVLVLAVLTALLFSHN